MEPMRLTAVVNLVVALILIAGGVMGARSGSQASLYAGVGSGVMMIVGVIGMFAQLRWGLTLTFVIAGLLAIFGLYRFATTQSFMPGGIIALVSIVALVVNTWAIYTGNTDSGSETAGEETATTQTVDRGKEASEDAEEPFGNDSES